MVIENLAFVIGELRSENFAKNEEFSEIALQCKEGKKSGVDHREIREKRENSAASVRVFRVFRGENASFFEPFVPFCGKSMEVL